MLSFMKNFADAKVSGVLDQAVGALVKWDPETATLADLKTQEDALDALGRKVSQARSTYSDDVKKLDAITKLYNERVTAAEILQKKISAPGANTDVAGSLSKSLDSIVKLAEESTTEIDSMKVESNDAHDFLTTLEQAWTQKGEQLKSAKARLQSAARDQERAAQQKETAKQRADAARELAGLTQSVSHIDGALTAMQANAKRDREATDALNSKAKLLTPTDTEHEDSNIAAALAEARGVGTSPTTVTDRLTALKNRR